MSTTIQHTCRTAGEGTGGRVLNLEHHRDCNLSGCPGCLPCEPRWGHCRRCRHAHLDADHPATCATCVGQVRQDILTIGDHITEAHDQHVHRAISSIAFMLTAPAGNYEAGMFVHQSAMSGRLCRCRTRGLPVCLGDIPPVQGPRCELLICSHRTCYAIRRPPTCPDVRFILEELRLDEMHPFTVFGAWELHWRHLLDLELDRDDIVEHTTWSSARFILEHLTQMAQAHAEESDFGQLAAEVAASRRWLEDVLRLDDRPDRGVQCPVCGKSDLIKVYDTTDEGAEEYDEARFAKVYNDLWTCTNDACGQVWTEAEYREKVQGIYVQKADRLTASQLRETYRVPEGSTRGWAAKGLVKKRGKDLSGRQLYDVADTLRQRDRTANLQGEAS